MLQKIICMLAYGTSINEQIGLWRWKRLLGPRRRPMLIEIKKATGCKMFAAFFVGKSDALLATAYQKILYYDPNARQRALRKLAIISMRTP